MELEFENVGFEERGKPEYPEENLSEQGREPTTNSTHIIYGVDARSWTRATLVGGEGSHHRVILAPQREKKTACRVKVTNWSEQSLHQKYSGTTRVYSLSCWNFFVPPLIKPTDLEWNSQLVQTILANVTNTVIDKQKQNKFSTHEWVMWTFNSVNPSNSFSWSGSYLAGQKTLSRFFFFQILMKTSKQIYIDIATKSTLKLWNLPSLKVKRPKWAKMLPNKVLQTTIQTSVKFRDFAVFAELYLH